MGKYCVRFGNDIRQFCSSMCLEKYKKQARVCFHCQLDIKKLPNVMLVNLPNKSPKEFCSQDCVEMYVESNIPNSNTALERSRRLHYCSGCHSMAKAFRQLSIAGATVSSCSEPCWHKILAAKGVKKCQMCTTCPKSLNVDFDVEPSFEYVVNLRKLFPFCSPTCKNVFVLRNRQILPCTTCKVCAP